MQDTTEPELSRAWAGPRGPRLRLPWHLRLWWISESCGKLSVFLSPGLRGEAPAGAARCWRYALMLSSLSVSSISVFRQGWGGGSPRLSACCGFQEVACSALCFALLSGKNCKQSLQPARSRNPILFLEWALVYRGERALPLPLPLSLLQHGQGSITCVQPSLSLRGVGK